MQPFDTCSHRSGMVHSISAWAHLARWYISEREPVFACGYDGRAAFGFRLGRLGLSTAILIPLCERSYRALAGSVWQIRFLHRQHVDRTLLCFPLLFALTSFLSCCCAVLGSCCSAVLLCCLLSCFSPLLSFPGLLLLVSSTILSQVAIFRFQVVTPLLLASPNGHFEVSSEPRSKLPAIDFIFRWNLFFNTLKNWMASPLSGDFHLRFHYHVPICSPELPSFCARIEVETTSQEDPPERSWAQQRSAAVCDRWAGRCKTSTQEHKGHW